MSADIKFGTDGWRAVIGAEFTYDSLRRVADAAGRVFSEDNPGGLIIVGYDTRFEAGSFAAAAAEVLATHGLRVRLSDSYLPTPALCWSVATEDEAVGGVMLTASHNPSEYLGFKLRMADGGASPVAFTARVEEALWTDPPTARGEYETVNLVGPYLDTLRSKVDAKAIKAAGLRVIVDPLYGAGQNYLATILREFGMEVVEIHGTRNPGFGGLHPEPIPPWTDDAATAVRDGGFDAAFVTDGDADRIGAIDSLGRFISPHKIIALVVRHLVEDKKLTGKVVKTVSTSVIVDRLTERLGLETITTPVGFKWIYEEMVKGGVLLGGEESGGIGIPSHVRERDGLLMALMLAEMMAQRSATLGGLVEQLFALTGPMEYSRLDLRLTPEVMADFLARSPQFAQTELAGIEVHEISRLDGVKFFLADDAWLLMRTSGTEPLVRIYAEAPSAGVVDDLLAAGRALVEGP
ncbi:MAG: phosphoglucosamine mutase [Actinobacteria bacterium HGW-Actinobacteria-7]|jgi:phosphomannomutase|nr:MAG: phosphoglucosamine mutase [Actinobacteria bacterium HGW-Actinobacteria-7]